MDYSVWTLWDWDRIYLKKLRQIAEKTPHLSMLLYVNVKSFSFGSLLSFAVAVQIQLKNGRTSYIGYPVLQQKSEC